jgi:hypothetical protein
VGGARDARQIERLTGAELHAGPQHQRDLLAVTRQARLDGLLRDGVLAGARGELDERACGVQIAPRDLGCDRMAVRGEGPGLHEDARASPARPVEARQHQVQIHRQRVHGHDFAAASAGQLGQVRGEVLVVGHPRAARLLVAGNPQARPLVEFGVDQLAGAERQQAERMTAQVDERLATLVARQREARAQAAQRVGGIACLGGAEWRGRHTPASSG